MNGFSLRFSVIFFTACAIFSKDARLERFVPEGMAEILAKIGWIKRKTPPPSSTDGAVDTTVTSELNTLDVPQTFQDRAQVAAVALSRWVGLTPAAQAPVKVAE